jgi:beta-glucosidase
MPGPAGSAGDTYFTFGCTEVVHRRELRVGEIVELVVEFSSAVPAGDNSHNFAVLRIGAARVLGEPDIAEAVKASREADLAIVFAGLNAEWDSEGLDRPGIELPHRQNELIARVAEANLRTVVVLQSGAPLLLPLAGRSARGIRILVPRPGVRQRDRRCAARRC